MPSVPLQLFGHYPAIPPPVPVELWESPPHPCSYLPDRQARMRALMTQRIPPDIYHDFMDANFRRSGNLVYQPACDGCRACRSLRVVTAEFMMTKSQRRCWRKSGDLSVEVKKLEPSAQKFQIYQQYQREWHGRDDSSYDDFCRFLYDSPVDTLEFEYRGSAGELLAVGICDRSTRSLSSVYFYFDTSKCNRSLGTFVCSGRSSGRPDREFLTIIWDTLWPIPRRCATRRGFIHMSYLARTVYGGALNPAMRIGSRLDGIRSFAIDFNLLIPWKWRGDVNYMAMHPPEPLCLARPEF